MEEFKHYTIDYRYKGSLWVADISATSREDAEARLNQIKNESEITGPITTIPASHKPNSHYGDGLLWEKPH